MKKKKGIKFWNDSIQEIAKLRKPAISHSFTPEYKIGDKLTLDMGNNTVEEVTVIEITPHDCVPNSVYYTFSNGVVCRDIRLH